MDIVSILGTLVGVVGLALALFENKKKKNLEEYVRANNWFNYQRANNANGTVQLALRLYKEKHSEKIDVDVLEQLSRSDAFGQEVFKEIIRQIHMFEPSFTKKDFERWKQEGKLTDEKLSLFLQFATDAKVDMALTSGSTGRS